MAFPPKVSVITVVLNGAQHLAGCLESVASQKNVAVEHIVVDGGSTDGCVDLLGLWSERLAFWSSEPDAGIADGMNKGIRRATGEWVLFLHADDYFAGPDALAQAISRVDENIDVAAFPVLFGTPPVLKIIAPRRTGVLLNVKLGMCHQGILTRRDLFSRLGLHDTSFKITMDYDFFLRAYRSGARLKAFRDPTLSVMRDTGISSRVDWPSLKKRLDEERRAHFKNACNPGQRLMYRFYWLLYGNYRRLRAAVGNRPR